MASYEFFDNWDTEDDEIFRGQETLYYALDCDDVRVTLTPNSFDQLCITKFQDNIAEEDSINKKCSICQENYTTEQQIVTIPPCQHFFHVACLRTWLTTYNRSCPICRETRNGVIKTDTNIVGAPYEYYQSLKNTYKTYDVILWSYASLLQIFPEEMAYMMHHMDHAVQLIDFFRWKVVERYGGLYIQIGTKIRFKDLNKLMPRQPYGIRLFTEFVLPTFMCNQAKQYPIRDGKAEDSVRVMTQVFATHQANHPFVTQCCEKIYQNIVCCATTVTCDYDILYLTGNCCITEEYHKAWKSIPASMELTGWIGSLLLIHLQGQGSWRRDNSKP